MLNRGIALFATARASYAPYARTDIAQNKPGFGEVAGNRLQTLTPVFTSKITCSGHLAVSMDIVEWYWFSVSDLAIVDTQNPQFHKFPPKTIRPELHFHDNFCERRESDRYVSLLWLFPATGAFESFNIQELFTAISQ